MEKLSDFLGHKPQPEGNGAQNKSADFISPRKLQPNESLIEKLRGSPANHTADYDRGIDRLVQGSSTYCRNPTASGLSKLG